MGAKLHPKIEYKLRGGVRNWVEIYGMSNKFKPAILMNVKKTIIRK